MMKPTAAELKSLTSLLAAYMVADGARIETQQRFYNRYMRKFSALETKYPRVDFRSDASQKGLVLRAKARIGARVVRGTGSSF